MRLTSIPAKPPRVLKFMIEQYLGVDVDKVESIPTGAVVYCPDANVQQQVLNLAGHSLEGKVVKCSCMDSTLSCEQLCDFISDRQETDMKLHNLRSTWDTENR